MSLSLLDIEKQLSKTEQLKKELSIQKNLLETIFHVIPDLIWPKDLD